MIAQSPDTEQPDDGWHVQLVKPTGVESLQGFVRFVFVESNPHYQFRNGHLWKSACSISVWDDGRVFVQAEDHLTVRQRGIVAGLGQEYWRGGPEQCRREKWRRKRQTTKRPVGSYATCFWVRADREDPGYTAAHADAQIVAQASWKSFDSTSERSLDEAPTVLIGGAR